MKKFGLFACLAVMVAVLGMCGRGVAATVQLGHAYSSHHPMHITLAEFAAEVKEKTGGKYNIEIVHSGVLGGETELIQQTLGGMLDVSFLGGINSFQGFAPKTAVEDLPFIFTDRAAAHRAFDGAFGKRIIDEEIEPLGLKAIMYVEHGFRQVTNNVRPIKTPADLAGIKLRVPPLAARVEAFKLFGANPVPMALPELFTALQQGTVDGQENPLSTIESYKFNEVQKYLSLTNHTYATGLLVFNRDTWNAIDPATRQIILDAGKNATALSRQLYTKYENESLERIKASGTQVTADVDYAAFSAAVEPMWDAFAKKYGAELIDLIKQAERE